MALFIRTLFLHFGLENGVIRAFAFSIFDKNRTVDKRKNERYSHFYTVDEGVECRKKCAVRTLFLHFRLLSISFYFFHFLR